MDFMSMQSGKENIKCDFFRFKMKCFNNFNAFRWKPMPQIIVANVQTCNKQTKTTMFGLQFQFQEKQESVKTN